MLNKQKGNMYGFVTHTWNPIKGKCSHDCKYCYMKVWKQKPIRLVEKELQDDLGVGNFIFVGSSTDMFASDVPSEWISKVLCCCKVNNKNKYLFQTKNPARFKEFIGYIPKNSVLGTTLETNLDENLSKAPLFEDRTYWMLQMKQEGYDTMITIEPIVKFVLESFVDSIKKINPEWVNIGADSKGHHLPEPSKEKIETLIKELGKFTEVRLKPNLKRLYSPSTEKMEEQNEQNKV